MKSFFICHTIQKLSSPNNGYTKEFNLIIWNNREPVFDIRTWNAEHTEYGSGTTLTVKQLIELKQLLDKVSINDISSMNLGDRYDEGSQ